MDILKEINELKKIKKAVIIAHNYQLPEIQDIADILGDSLDLSRKSKEVKENTIVFCGVKFMAETAKILSPEKTVLLPAIDAGCKMADMADVESIIKMKKDNPKAKVVCYVNTTAEVKAHCDICCTSSNAVKVVNSIDADEIIFVPDKNLADYVSKQTDKKIIPYNGFCYVHEQFRLRDIENAKNKHPDALLFVHPESPPYVVEKADYVLSTGGMIKKAGEVEEKEIIIGTENEMIYRLKTIYPDKHFYPLKENPPAICTNMKKTHIQDVYDALKFNRYIIEIDKNIRKKAFDAINKILEI